MFRVAQQNHELDHHRLTLVKQRLEQEEDRIRKEQTLMLAELEDDFRRKLAEATLTKFELAENVTKASQSLQDALCEPSANS